MLLNVTNETVDTAIAAIKTHHNNGLTLETDAAIKVIIHMQANGHCEVVNKLAEVLEEFGTKNSAKAFRLLAFKQTGATKKGTVDKERQNKSKDTFEAVLNTVNEMGLTEWYLNETGQNKVVPILSDADKQVAKDQRAEKTAKAWMVKQAETDPTMKAMLEYGDSFKALYAKNPSQAVDQCASDISHMKKGLSAVLNSVAS